MANKEITGTAGDDVLVSTKEYNRILGNGGNDTITFQVDGGTAFGGQGDDVFHLSPPGVAQVHAYGGQGNDTFYIDTSSRVAPYGVHAWGGEGKDKFVFTNLGASSARMTGRLDDFDPSRDEIWVDDTKVDLRHPPDGVRLLEYHGQPWVMIDNRVLYALEGARATTNTVNNLSEEVHFIDWPAEWQNGVPQSANLSYDDFVTFFPADKISGSESALKQIRGTSGNDTLAGGAEGEYLRGGDGFDTLRGNGGDDIIDGEERNDLIYGGDGNDSLSGGLDQDIIFGGNGNDIAYGGSGHDILHGDAGNDTLSGNSGNDLVFGGKGNDVIYGGSGKDVLLGGEGSDKIFGGKGNDLLVADGSKTGKPGSNQLNGGEGNDTLVGANGQSTEMTGGEGSDIFVAAGKGEITIKDFDASKDKLDLRGQLDAEAKLKDHVTRLDRGDDSGITDLRVNLPEGGSALIEGGGSLSDAQLDAAVLRSGNPIDVDAEVAAQTQRIEGTPDLSGATEHRDGGTDVPSNSELDYVPPQENQPDYSNYGGGGCFVATASFGGIDHPDVTWLRKFRDSRLVFHPAGRAFIRFYWTVGPVMARFVNAKGPSGKVSRWIISGIVVGLKRLVNGPV